MQTSQSKSKVKLLMLGDSGVGKSSILNRFTDEKFTTDFFTTLGVEYKQKNIEVKGRQILLQIWDTAGQERFKTITPVYYKSVDGVVLVYDITEPKSFENVDYWLQNLSDHADRSKMSFVLAANKADMPNKQIPTKDGEEIAKKDQHNMVFYECSAKSNLNITQLFLDITQDVLEKRKESPMVSEGEGLKSPEKSELQKNQKKSCCS